MAVWETFSSLETLPILSLLKQCSLMMCVPCLLTVLSRISVRLSVSVLRLVALFVIVLSVDSAIVLLLLLCPLVRWWCVRLISIRCTCCVVSLKNRS